MRHHICVYNMNSMSKVILIELIEIQGFIKHSQSRAEK